MPGTEVGIGLYGPPLSVPGFRSKVSLWLGTPSIQSRIHALCLTPLAAARAAGTFSQPDIDVAATPAPVSFRKSRREKLFIGISPCHSSSVSGLKRLTTDEINDSA